MPALPPRPVQGLSDESGARRWLPSAQPETHGWALGLRVAEELECGWPPASRPARASRVPNATPRHGLPSVPPTHGMPASGRGLHHLQVQLQFVDVLLLRRDMRFEHRPQGHRRGVLALRQAPGRQVGLEGQAFEGQVLL